MRLLYDRRKSKVYQLFYDQAINAYQAQQASYELRLRNGAAREHGSMASYRGAHENPVGPVAPAPSLPSQHSVPFSAHSRGVQLLDPSNLADPYFCSLCAQMRDISVSFWVLICIQPWLTLLGAATTVGSVACVPCALIPNRQAIPSNPSVHCICICSCVPPKEVKPRLVGRFFCGFKLCVAHAVQLLLICY